MKDVLSKKIKKRDISENLESHAINRQFGHKQKMHHLTLKNPRHDTYKKKNPNFLKNLVRNLL